MTGKELKDVIFKSHYRRTGFPKEKSLLPETKLIKNT